MILSLRALNRATLARQMLLRRERVAAKEVVARLAGLQAQVPKPPFLGLWSRIQDFQRDELQRLIAKREVVRATMMRGTIHLVTRNDFLKWRAPLQPMLARGARAITKLPESFDIDGLCAEGRRFFDEEPRTFEELRDHLTILHPGKNARLLAYTVRMHLPLVLVPNESPWSYAANADFAAAETWLRKPVVPSTDATDLALRYLAAFGPATVADFQTWSGLQTQKATFEALRPKLVTFHDEKKRELFDLPDAPRPFEDVEAPVRFLPDYDNLLLSHADRRRVIADADRKKIVTGNLRVLGTFLVDGVVAGTWIVEKNRIVTTPFGKLTKVQLAQLKQEKERLEEFLAGA